MAVDRQVSKPLPPQRLLVQCCQTKHTSSLQECELEQLISRAWCEMDNHSANLWSLSSTANAYFLHKSGNKLRDDALKYGVFNDYTEKLGLIYGAFFGFKVLHDARRYTRFGQVKDDVERTLHYWHCDCICVRFGRYGAMKRKPPGKYKATKGGISANTDAAGHKAEGQHALRSILSTFAWRYARVPKATENVFADCGLIWLPRTQQFAADADDAEAPGMDEEVGAVQRRRLWSQGRVMAKRAFSQAPQAGE